MSSPPNPLDPFRSQTVHHFLYASYSTEALRNLFEQDAGTQPIVQDKTGKPGLRLKDVGSIFNNLASEFRSREDISDQKHKDIVLIINPTHDADFTIQSVDYDVIGGGEMTSGTVIVKGELKIKVREAFGCSFLNYLKFMQVELFKCNFSGISFALKTVIIGLDDAGNATYFEMKPKILMLDTIQSSFDENGSTHDMSFFDCSMGVTVSNVLYGQIPLSLSIKGNTFGDQMRDLEKGLNDLSATYFNTFNVTALNSKKTDKNVGRMVKYHINYPGKNAGKGEDPGWSNASVSLGSGSQTVEHSLANVPIASEWCKNIETVYQMDLDKAKKAKEDEEAKTKGNQGIPGVPGSTATDAQIAEAKAQLAKEYTHFTSYWTYITSHLPYFTKRHQQLESTVVYEQSTARATRSQKKAVDVLNVKTPSADKLEQVLTDGVTSKAIDYVELHNTQCEWITKWNNDHADDHIYDIPKWPGTDDKKALDAKLAAKGLDAKPSEQKVATTATKSNVPIRTMIGNIILRCDAIKNDCVSNETMTIINQLASRMATSIKQAKTAKQKGNNADYKALLDSIDQNKKDIVNIQSAYLKTKKNVADDKGQLAVYTIRDQLTSDENSVTVHYDIIKKYLPNPLARLEVMYDDLISNTQTMPTQKNPSTDPKNANGSCITFDYIFTGKNIDIESFEMHNTDSRAYLMTDVNVPNNSTGHNSELDTKLGKAGDNLPLGTPRRNTSFTVIRDHDPIYSPTIPADQATNNYSHMTQASAKVHLNYMKTFSSFMAMGNLNVAITIRGNPDIMNSCTTTIYPHDNAKYEALYRAHNKAAFDMVASGNKSKKMSQKDVKVISELDMIHFPLFAKINVMMPVDKKNSKVGTVGYFQDVTYESFWYDGWYHIMEVSNNFNSEGHFSQTLKLMPYDLSNIFSPETTAGGGS